MKTAVKKNVVEYIRQRLSPWCKCLCRLAPDGTKCTACGHAHSAEEPFMTHTLEREP